MDTVKCNLIGRAETARMRLNKLSHGGNCHRVAQLIQTLLLALDGVGRENTTEHNWLLLDDTVNNAEDYLVIMATRLFRRRMRHDKS